MDTPDFCLPGPHWGTIYIYENTSEDAFNRAFHSQQGRLVSHILRLGHLAVQWKYQQQQQQHQQHQQDWPLPLDCRLICELFGRPQGEYRATLDASEPMSETRSTRPDFTVRYGEGKPCFAALGCSESFTRRFQTFFTTAEDLEDTGLARFRPVNHDLIELLPFDEPGTPAAHAGGGQFAIKSSVDLLYCPGDGQGKWDRPVGNFTSAFASDVVFEDGENTHSVSAVIRYSNSRNVPWTEAAVAAAMRTPEISSLLLRSCVPQVLLFGKPASSRMSVLRQWLRSTQPDDIIEEEKEGEDRKNCFGSLSCAVPLSKAPQNTLRASSSVYLYDRRFFHIFALEPWMVAVLCLEYILALTGLFEACGFVHGDVSTSNFGSQLTAGELQAKQAETFLVL